MENYKGKKVLIFGLGLNDGGLGMAEFFLKNGEYVTITDGKTEEQLKETLEKLDSYKERITLHLSGHIEKDFVENDIIVRNPAIKSDNEWLQLARKNGKEIVMEMALFHKLAPCKIIGVTGTRGKSTTTTLIYEFLKEEYGKRVLLGGNIGKSAVRELENLDKNSIAVLEISSFQLDGMGESRVSSHIAVVTNIYPDHLNWHKDMDDYINAKKKIFLNQNENDYLIVNIDNDITRDFSKEAKGNVLTFSLKNRSADYYLDSNELKIYESGREIFRIEGLKIGGEHNLYNILGAFVASKVIGVKDAGIESVLESFVGVEGRQELVREINGVRFYNDTTATSLEAIIAMFQTFGEENKGKIVMISGGMEKGFDYNRVVPYMQKYLKHLILLDGTASEKILESIEGKDIPCTSGYTDFEKAIRKSYELSSPGDMVILCPGAASFNMFANEFDRGKQYVKYVNSI